jgi:5'(3')-deoxyribonucleotidase
MITRIFLDIDGVLANWVRGVCDMHGLDVGHVLRDWPADTYDICDATGLDPAEMWERIHLLGTGFWANLRLYPWASSLVALLEPIAPVTLLSSPSRHHSSSGGKHAWIQSYMPSFERRFLLGADKAACARPGAVLIDDSDANCRAFEAAGGHAIVFPQPWNSAREHYGPGIVDHIRNRLAQEAW